MCASSSSFLYNSMRLRCFHCGPSNLPEPIFPKYNMLYPKNFSLSKTISPSSNLQVRAAEDILSLTRILKESWLFGKLETVSTSDAEDRADEAARKVAGGLSRLQSRQDEAGTQPLREQAKAIDSARDGKTEDGGVS